MKSMDSNNQSFRVYKEPMFINNLKLISCQSFNQNIALKISVAANTFCNIPVHINIFGNIPANMNTFGDISENANTLGDFSVAENTLGNISVTAYACYYGNIYVY